MRVEIKELVGPEFITGGMRVTTGKEMSIVKEPKLETYYNLLVAKHSPIRAHTYRVFVYDISYCTHVHFVRHHVGLQFYVFSQRSVKGREKLTQDEPVNMFFDANAEALLTLATKRLCGAAAKETRKVMSAIKNEFTSAEDPFTVLLGRLMMPPCEYYQGICPEMKPCKKNVKKLADLHKDLLEGLM